MKSIIPPAQALDRLLLITAWWGGWMPVQLGCWTPREVIWRRGTDVRPRQRLSRIVAYLDREHDEEVILRLPVRAPWEEGVGVGSVLWCRVSGTDQVRRAARFRPLPSLVLQEGGASQRLLFWALERPVPWLVMREQNRRIAYKLGAVQKHGDPDELRFWAPGTFLREGRSRPAPVSCSRLVDDEFPVGTFTGHRGLKDPPAPPEWLGR